MTDCRCDECRSFWHDPERPYRCEVCGRRWMSHQAYLNHLSRHEPGELAKRLERRLTGDHQPPDPHRLPDGFHLATSNE